MQNNRTRITDGMLVHSLLCLYRGVFSVAVPTILPRFRHKESLDKQGLKFVLAGNAVHNEN